MNKTEKENLIKRYEAAFLRANGNSVSVHNYGTGWYAILREDEDPKHALNKLRIAALETMTIGLEERADEQEAAANRTGFIVKIAPPRLERYKHMTERYYVSDGNWSPFRDCPTVFVFNGAHEADSVANEVNEGLPFDYAEIEPF